MDGERFAVAGARGLSGVVSAHGLPLRADEALSTGAHPPDQSRRVADDEAVRGHGPGHHGTCTDQGEGAHVTPGHDDRPGADRAALGEVDPH